MSQHRNPFTGGLALVLRSWPALVWTYVLNLGLAVLFSLPLHQQLSSITAHSFAAQRLMAGFDLGVIADISRKAGEGSSATATASYFAIPTYLLLYFLLVPGTLFCYQTEAPARLSTLLQSGIAYFWRFVRITLISLAVFGVVLGLLLALQNKWAAHVDEHIVGRSSMLHDLAGMIVIGLVAAVLRLYFDLVEIHTVQLGLQLRTGVSGEALRSDRRVRRVLLPAWRNLRRRFVSGYLIFVVLTLLGLSAVIVTARIAVHSLAQPRIWPVFLLTQIGLFLMMLTRFWQRGAEMILAMDDVVLPVAEPVIVDAPLPSAEYGPL